MSCNDTWSITQNFSLSNVIPGIMSVYYKQSQVLFLNLRCNSFNEYIVMNSDQFLHTRSNQSWLSYLLKCATLKALVAENIYGVITKNHITHQSELL